MSITIEPGTSLAHYRIIAPVGAGGMGQVYKAHDLTLDRTLALKILPPELLRNDERVRRFMQEARSASSLNHPNIITIYEIGQTDSIHYIAMELIDGATLKRKIHGDTDLRTLLGYLAQAAEGLAKAHAAGIIHRDLKPENIMVTRDGYAKVLDFGLAKLTVKRSPDETKDATIERGDTREGALLGTVGYMSPEQVQGKQVDHRSDIFSFGAILYEAATKRRPFEADSDIDIMHKIVHDKPPAIDEINPSVPAELRRLIRRCLAKDPEKRHQSMKNLSLELMEIVEEFEQLSASASSRSASVSGEGLAAPRRRRWIPVAIVAALAVAAFGIYQWMRPTATGSTAKPAFSAMQMAPLTTSGDVQDAAISPDGKYVAQIRRGGEMWELAVRQVATGSDVTIVPSSALPLFYVSFAPDGNYIYYVRYDNPAGSGYGTLYQIPVLGGPARKISFDVDTKVTVSPDGKQIAFGRGEPQNSRNHLIIANADGTGERILMTYPRLAAPIDAAWAPDGKVIVLPRRTREGGVRGEYMAVDVATGKVRAVGPPWMQIGPVAFLSDGTAFVMAAGPDPADLLQVWMQPYPEGEPVRITNDLNVHFELSVTADGKTICSVQNQNQFDVLSFDPKTASTAPFTTRMGSMRRPIELSVARNGAVAVDVATDRGIAVAMIDQPGAVPRVLTGDQTSAQPSISADGRLIAFRSRRDRNDPKIYVMDTDGGNVRVLAEGTRPEIAPDGSYVLYFDAEAALWKVPVGGGAPVKLAPRTDLSCAISPDGKRIAYTYRKVINNRNVMHLAVIRETGGALEVDRPFTLAAAARMRFDEKGEAIVYRAFANGGANIFSQPLEGGPPKPVTNFTSGAIASFDLAPGGKVVFTGGETRSDAVLIRNFR